MCAIATGLFRYYGHTLLPAEKPLENSGLKVLQHLSLKVTPPNQFNDLFEFSPVIEERSAVLRSSNPIEWTLIRERLR